MSRTTIKIELKENYVDDVLNVIESKLTASKYQQKVIDGETVWTRCDTILSMRLCVKVAFDETAVFLQSWMKDPVFGEFDLDSSIVGIQPNRDKLKKILNEIVAELNA